MDAGGDARVRREDSLPTGRLVAGCFDGRGGVHKTHFGLRHACRFFALGAPFYNAFVAAVKDALWHADTGYVLAAAVRAGSRGWYWYFLATPSLMLDRPAGSATLEVPFTESQESTPDVSSRKGTK